MSLKILSITKTPPAAPYGDATRKRPLDIVVELPDLSTQSFNVHEGTLDEFVDSIMRRLPPAADEGTVLAVLWGLWKHRKRGATMASLIGVDIEQ